MLRVFALIRNECDIAPDLVPFLDLPPYICVVLVALEVWCVLQEVEALVCIARSCIHVSCVEHVVLFL